MYSIEDLKPFIRYKTSRSGGSGGQHVNKVSSKIELQFDFEACKLWNEEDKTRIRQKLCNRLSSEGKLQIISQEDRSQFRNKMLAQKKLIDVLANVSQLPKLRKPSKRSKASIHKRLDNKRRRALMKINRSKLGKLD